MSGIEIGLSWLQCTGYSQRSFFVMSAGVAGDDVL